MSTARRQRRVAEKLARKQRQFHEQVAQWNASLVEGRKTVVTTYTTFAAMNDSRIGRGAATYMIESFRSAQAGSCERECFGCLECWTMARPVAGILVVEQLPGDPRQSAEMGILAGLCARCASDAGAILRGLKRDFGPGFEDVTITCTEATVQ